MAKLRVELHCHTVYSPDGQIEFDALLAAARGRLDVICITDHDTIEGARDFQRRSAARNSGIQLVVGEERTLADGSHIIGLFLKEAISSDTFDDAVHEIREQGGFSTLPHPFRHRDGVLREIAYPLHGVSGFEIFNPKCSFHENERARTLCGSGLIALGGSDAHYKADLGECINLIPYAGDLRTSLENFFGDRAPYEVIGVRQSRSGQGRQYAPLYYRVRPYVPVPRPLLPVAKRLYRAYRNATSRWRSLELEIKYASR